jgi:ABC-type sulfate transport system permease component
VGIQEDSAAGIALLLAFGRMGLIGEHLRILGIEAGGGAVTAWARALGEFGRTIIFAGGSRGATQTMPLAIYSTLESDFDAAVALAVLVLGFSFVVILTARFFTRMGEEREGQ